MQYVWLYMCVYVSILSGMYTHILPVCVCAYVCSVYMYVFMYAATQRHYA